MQALVLIVPYANEERSLSMVETLKFEEIPLMHPPQLDVETFLFVARHNMRPQKQNQLDRKAYYKFGVDDHWQKECPFDKKT